MINGRLTKDAFTFPWVEKGSKYLIKEFPNEKEYQDAKEKFKIYNPKLKGIGVLV